MVSKLASAERFRRLTMQALVLLGIVVLVGGLAVAFYYVPLPDTGFEFIGNSKVGAITPGGPAELAGLQVGDRIVSIGGSESSPTKAYLCPGQEAVQLTISRDGEVLPLEITLASPSSGKIFDRLAYFSLALAYWAIAAAVLFLKPRDSVSQLFILVALLSTVGIVTWPMADLGALWANLLMPFVALAVAPLFVHFHTLFPERSDFRGRRILLMSMYGISLVLLILSTASDLVFYLGSDGGGEWLPSLAPAIKVYFSLCLLVGLGLLVRTQRVTRSETSRRRIALVMLGTTLALLPLILLIFLPQVLSDTYPVSSWLPLFALIFIPLSYAYATYRHSLLKLDRAINRSVVYLLLSFLLAGLYLLLALGVRRLMPGLSSGWMALAEVVPVLALVFVLEPLKQQIERLVDRAFYGGWYDYESLVFRLTGALLDALDPQSIVDLLVRDVADTMRLKASAVLLAEPAEGAFFVRGSKGFGSTAPVSADGVLTTCLLEGDEPVPHAALRERLSWDPVARQELALWSEAGVQIWVPLVQQGELLGLLVLGSKLADDFYYADDHRILSTIAHQAAVALAQTRLVDQLQARIEEIQVLAGQLLALQEENQKRLAGELHDQVLQDLFVARMYLEEAQEQSFSDEVAEARRVLLQIAGYLRTVIMELRPPAWENSDLRTLLADYAQTIAERRDLPILFQARGDNRGESVTEEIRIALFRILQECLNNARKHADAGQIRVTLDVQPERAYLEVQDNGVGFEVPSHFAAHLAGGRLGLIGMRERAAGVGGRFHLESQPGLGTRVAVEVPLPAS